MTPRLHFDEQLKVLNKEMLKMGSLIERSLKGATFALTNNDKRKARRIIDSDEQINRKERDIESLCIKLLLQQQPVARDLRTISAALKMISDMERIGDQASDICEIVLASKVPLLSSEVGHLPELAEATTTMVIDAINSFVNRDVDFAHRVMEQDFHVDELFMAVRKELIKLIRHDETLSEVAIDRLMIAKYFERIGDHAENIAEWVEYSITGYYKGEILG
ncbi:MAG: phosphate signaling complex protein PhoU [Coriobacteriales bacterium]|jgi:phosphate transport system protein|nr:phosphate signaling complex protein PhoU [Coriobacteriales bacterium]